MPGRYDKSIPRGDSLDILFEFTDAAGNALYWAGQTFRAQLRRGPDNSEFLEFDIDDSQLAFGRVVISIDKTVTQALEGAYVYDLEHTDGAGKRKTKMQGNIFFAADVTRDAPGS